MTKSSKPEVPTVRCAIYTRKSTEEGLDQEFNSLDAQRDAAVNYGATIRGIGKKPQEVAGDISIEKR